ncbi:MAG: hypothetical protein IPO17_07870 [Flavobacteriales bacterium]|nr:hypothetical protein [Flavobacteriales bacterium]
MHASQQRWFNEHLSEDWKDVQGLTNSVDFIGTHYTISVGGAKPEGCQETSNCSAI